MRRRSLAIVALTFAVGCLEEDLPNNTGSLGGQVVISGPVRGAVVTVDQLDPHSGSVYRRVGEATTDHDGRFTIERTGEASGVFRIVARGGSFEDLATHATVQLDDTDELNTLIWFELLDQRRDALVSPVGHLVDAKAWATREAFGGDLAASLESARRSLHQHFGSADWTLLELADLGKPQQSPTAPVRAAFVHAALSYLVREIGEAANASPQQLNVYTLLRQWVADLAPAGELGARFDGNDDNSSVDGSGLQLGLCEPVPAGCVVPPVSCATGACRSLCDLYVGTPRAMLAGAITRVIREDVNRTGLRIEDLLAVARGLATNKDPDLFGDECIENLDRTPPILTWDNSASPADNAVVRGTITLKAIAIDDVDLAAQTRTEIVGHPDADGDPANNVAVAVVDTASSADGGLTVTARATDLAGNTTTIERRIVVDNTAPQLAVGSAGFFIDDDNSTWWTTQLTPTLSGTFVEEHPATVQATIGATQIAGTIAGSGWSIELPAVATTGADVTIRITDRAGNATEVIRRIRYDGTEPVLALPASMVMDEAAEMPDFAIDESPIHSHNGTPVDLAATGACPSITKYSYLLGSVSPAYVTETPTRNPIAYRLVASDDGVGIVDGSTQYRVLRRGTTGATVVLNWTSVGSGTPIGSDARLFEIAVVSTLVAGLASTEATYDVEFRATDRLSRTAMTSRCVDLRLKAPPLHFGTGGPASGHTFALNSLSLQQGAPVRQVAARLLNDNATGASLIDQRLVNGTAETVFLTVTVTKPTSVTAVQEFAINNVQSVTSVDIFCGIDPDNPNPACLPAPDFPSPEYMSTPISTPYGESSPLMFPAKLYELDAAGLPANEISCLAPCSPSGAVFKFAIPPRASGGAPARKFMVMTMVGQVKGLWPTDTNHPAFPSFSDTSINGIDYTGRLQFSESGCFTRTTNGTRCTQRMQRKQYRALTRAKLTFSSQTRTAYATSPTEQVAPIEATDPKSRLADPPWETQESELP